MPTGMTVRVFIVIAFIVSIALRASLSVAFDQNMQMTGSAFSDSCTRADESWISFCNGYIQAAVDGLRQGDGVCIPSGTTRTDLVTVVERTISGSSELMTINAHDAVRVAMRQSYPC